MQNPNPTQLLFLEDDLRCAITPSAPFRPSPPPSARAILQAWADLRQSPPSPHRLISALETLAAAKSSLHVADPHAALVLSLLTSAPPQSLPLLLRLLYIHARRSPRPHPQILLSVAQFLSSPPPPPAAAALVLLAGALSAANLLPSASRSAALDLACRLLDDHKSALTSDEALAPKVLAGIGYSLSRSSAPHSARILAALFAIWGDGGFRPSLPHGLMVLRLAEWCTRTFVGQRSSDRIESLCAGISKARSDARFAVVMASAGVLRAFRIESSSKGVEVYPRMRASVEGSIGSVAEYTISGDLEGNSERRLLLQCVSMGLARCGPVSFYPSVMGCLCSALLSEIFPLPSLFRQFAGDPNGNSSSFRMVNEVKEHRASVLFQEAGAVTGVLCNQYAFADEDSRVAVENHMWGYSHELYQNLRAASMVNRVKSNELFGDMEKIAEAAFLMVVVFAAEVSKQKLNPKSYREVQSDVAIKILSAFSCIEYLRRVRLAEYTDAVRRAVLTIQENQALSALFVESMPRYIELTNRQVKDSFLLEGMRYHWSEDEVQTSRMLFYLRVIPTCIGLITASLFGKLVAPTVFLYMQHPNEKVARASHSVFVAFVSSVKDSEQDDRSTLKEQLVFYYMQRALEAYPGVTPFEGLASGVAAVVRHLPAGSPATFYCLHCLVRKAADLCQKAMSRDVNLWKNWEGSSEPCKKVLDLLLRLVSLVDIQVFPYLLKQLAELVVQLNKGGQDVVLDEMYTQVSESDDVTRKPVLVSWLQSLSYLCSQPTSSSLTSGDFEASLNSASSRL